MVMAVVGWCEAAVCGNTQNYVRFCLELLRFFFSLFLARYDCLPAIAIAFAVVGSRTGLTIAWSGSGDACRCRAVANETYFFRATDLRAQMVKKNLL